LSLYKAIVTGGTRGIGKAIVHELATRKIGEENFADVAFIYNSCDSCAEEVLNELTASGAVVKAYKLDVSSFTDVQETVKQIISDFGSVDILVNNAGITKDNLLMRMSEEEFDKVIDVNLKSVFNFTKAVSRQMLKQRRGKIINISSVVGIIGNPGQANYSSSKAGIIGFTKSIAKEFASRGINVNAIAPGYIQTEMTDSLNESQQNSLLDFIPMKRMGKPEDIAKAVAFLAGDDASYITGQVITVDGGMVM
jgi:3-oxoacyl-[acyl-carrier protein] reductase